MIEICYVNDDDDDISHYSVNSNVMNSTDDDV